MFYSLYNVTVDVDTADFSFLCVSHFKLNNKRRLLSSLRLCPAEAFVCRLQYDSEISIRANPKFK